MKDAVEHSHNIFKVSIDATCEHCKPWLILKYLVRMMAHLELYHSDSDFLVRATPW